MTTNKKECDSNQSFFTPVSRHPAIQEILSSSQEDCAVDLKSGYVRTPYVKAPYVRAACQTFKNVQSDIQGPSDKQEGINQIKPK